MMVCKMAKHCEDTTKCGWDKKMIIQRLMDGLWFYSGWFWLVPSSPSKSLSSIMVVYNYNCPEKKTIKVSGARFELWTAMCFCQILLVLQRPSIGYTFKRTVLALLPKRTQDAPPTLQYGLYGWINPRTKNHEQTWLQSTPQNLSSTLQTFRSCPSCIPFTAGKNGKYHCITDNLSAQRHPLHLFLFLWLRLFLPVWLRISRVPRHGETVIINKEDFASQNWLKTNLSNIGPLQHVPLQSLRGRTSETDERNQRLSDISFTPVFLLWLSPMDVNMYISVCNMAYCCWVTVVWGELPWTKNIQQTYDHPTFQSLGNRVTISTNKSQNSLDKTGHGWHGHHGSKFWSIPQISCYNGIPLKLPL